MKTTKTPKQLLEANQDWASSIKENNPDFFLNLSKQQKPKYLWIGCSDSRVPANQITNLEPGEVFVHRNISNLVLNTDINLLSVLQFSIEILKVEHIIVCGHYGCGGVIAGIDPNRLDGVLEHWIQNIRDSFEKYKMTHEVTKDISDRMCEFNVLEQVQNLNQNSFVTRAKENGQNLSVHGWIYNLKDGIIHDLLEEIGQ